MLKTLTVTNFALIEQVVVEFKEGLNILTGETGAGKSILIDALNVILGGRASTDLIRSSADSFRIEAVFDISQLSELLIFCEEMGVDVEEDKIIILNRRLSRNGKNTILINGSHITLGILRQIGELLVDMHGQHENQTLLQPGSPITLLDQSDEKLMDCIHSYRRIYYQWIDTEKELLEMEKNAREREQRIDMLKWQTQEIAAAQLKVDEEESLMGKIRILSNAEKINEASTKAHILLSEGHKGTGGIVSLLSETIKYLDFIARYDKHFELSTSTAKEILYQLEDIAVEVRNHVESFEYNPSQLVELQERMDIIHKLKKKYGDSIEEVLQFYRNAISEMDNIANYDERLLQLTKTKVNLEKELADFAEKIDSIRQKVANELASQIQLQLHELGMPNGRLVIEVKRVNQFTANGCNEVTFLFSANTGEDIRPLHKVASGGELSRIALAIKTVSAAREKVGSMVFDEVDAGIGGKTAQMVAEKIARVAVEKQVLCITHLPQIACMADSHIYIEKKSTDEKTITLVNNLSPQEQLTELTRMITGNDVTNLAIENAAEMLRNAKNKKEKWKKRA